MRTPFDYFPYPQSIQTQVLINSVCKIEELTRVDFLSALSKKEQDRLETVKSEMWQ
jgi:hypothetical protein